MNEPILAAEALNFTYRGGRPALRNVTLAIQPGVTCVIGLNGAGKTTLLRIATGISRPSGGTIRWFGSKSLPRDAKSQIALMPQDFVPPPGFRVDEYLRYAAWLRDVPRRDARRAAQAALERVGLDERGADPIRELSGGMLRRLVLAQALVASPRLLLLDEPTTGLDPQQRLRIRELVRSLDPSMATVLSSHIVEDVHALADHLIVLHRGRVLLQGARSEVFNRLRVSEPAQLEMAFVHLVENASGSDGGA